MNDQKEKLESELRELWDDYANIGDEFLETANEIERDGDVSAKSMEKAESLITKALDIAERIQNVLWGGERE